MIANIGPFWILIASLAAVSAVPAAAAPKRTGEVKLGDIDTLIRNQFVFTTQSGQRYRVEEDVNVVLSRIDVTATVLVENGSHFISIPGISMSFRCTLLADALPIADTGQDAPAETIAHGSSQRR